jgi:hypothetical protein
VQKSLEQSDSLKKEIAKQQAQEGEDNEFWAGFEEGFQEGQGMKKAKQKPKSLRETLNDDDSSRLLIGRANSPKVSKTEFLNTPADLLIERYHITGFWDKLLLKQSQKMQKEGNSLVHFAITKLLWMTMLIIPILSLFFQFLYRRQKRYYVEHFVFLMHFNIFVFALGSIILLLNMNHLISESVYGWAFLAVLGFLYFAMRRYYQQGWAKTFAKFMIINFSYLVLSGLFMGLLAILSFLLF